MSSTSPLSSAQAARRAVADRLTELLRVSGMSGNELARTCGWNRSKVSRIARAVTLPSDADIRAWCAACGAAEHAADLVAQSRTAESMYVQWRELHREGMRAVHSKTTPLYQRTRQFRVYASNLVPGMLQTSGYATGLLRSITQFQGTPDDVERAVEARLERSRVVCRPGHSFALLVEETVLYHLVCPPEAMAEQLAHLLAVMRRPNVSLGVIPFGAPRQVWPLEAFYVFDEQLVAVETLTAEVNITAPGEVATYLRAFCGLTSMAVHGDRARARITRALERIG